MLNMTRFHVSLRASSASAAINEQRIPKKNPNTSSVQRRWIASLRSQ
ncbi:MAG: hypothetical protein K2N70_02260 [Helicobacter sp.]|nr:hypothetical protein [Helicobacter sp.]